MTSKMILDPSILLSPHSFAAHLAAVGDANSPFGIPISWLWEKLRDRYGLLDFSDCCNWLKSDIDKCLSTNLSLDVKRPDGLLSMLIASCHLGYAVPFATGSGIEFFEQGDWATYLSDALEKDIEEIDLDENTKTQSWELTLKVVSEETGVSETDLGELVNRNKKFKTRTSKEYAIYEKLRKLNIMLIETLAAIKSGKQISTPSPDTRSLLLHSLNSSDAFYIPPNKLPLQPLIEEVIINQSDISVRDVFSIAGTRNLSSLLSGSEKLAELIIADFADKALAKDTVLYLLGLIPGVGNISNAIAGADLLQKLWKAKDKQSMYDPSYLLYFCSTECNSN